MRVPRDWSFIALSSTSAILVGVFGTSCGKDPSVQSTTYFDRTIQPILTHSCSRQTTGCHVADAKGNAVGNLDTTGFPFVDRRHDLLVTYGPYSAPGLLTKVGGPQTLTVSTLDGPIEIITDIRHAAGSGIDVTSEGYATLRRWMDGGATEDNVGATSGTRLVPTGDCTTTIPSDPGFAGYDPGPTFGEFVDKVQPVLKNCSAGSCHGNIVADFSLTCGTDDAQQKWNHYIASQFLSGSPEASELLRRPLDPARGGVFHEGGIVFDSPDEPGYQAMLAWAKNQGPAVVDTTSPDQAGFVFFSNRVQPMMVRKGCMFLGCHSPQMFHDLRLRGGSGGQFSLVASRRNYAMSKLMLSIESPDPSVSRLIAKNLFPFDRDIDPKGLGIRHRGGALLEDTVASERATPADCAAIDAEKDDLSTIPAYCVFIAWHQKERDAAIAKGPTAGGVDKDALSGIVYVERPPNTDVPQAFDSYRPGAALHIHAATLSATGIVAMGADSDVTSGCGLNSATADIRGPAVSWDGQTIAFAARSAVDQPLAIYTMKSDGSACAKQAQIADHPPSEKGILEHDFDPTFSPGGQIVFASSRGATDLSNTEYKGPTLTPGSFLPNSNIYAVNPDGTIRQMTFLLGAELSPEFMRDGRLTFSVEKRAPTFYQIAGRRMNLDGGDYHPLFAQRKSVGFEQMTEIHELADRGFVGILSDKGALASGGTLGVVNRSLGPDQFDRDPADHFYLHSLTFPDEGATGKAGPGAGAYRSPSALPARAFLASYAAAVDAFAFDGTYELVEVNTHDGTRTPLVKIAGKSVVEAAAIYARPLYPVFESRLDEVNGATTFEPGQPDAQVHILDMTLLASLMFTNTRIGRAIDTNVLAVGFLESLPPTDGITSIDAAPPESVFSDDYGKFWLQRRRLGIVRTEDDGSLGVRLPGGVPLVLELYHDPGKAPVATQREEMEFTPGERSRVAFRGDFFDAQCGGCHGSVSGKEIDVHIRPDVLTSASRVEAFAKGKVLSDLFGAKGPVIPNDGSLAK